MKKNKLEIAHEIMAVMNEIEYGFPDDKGNNIMTTDFERWDNSFCDFYFLQSPEELQVSKLGVCWDQVELERRLFQSRGIETESYFICAYNGEEKPSHTILVFKFGENFYWFEHSWGDYKGIHKYSNKSELISDVVDKFMESNNITQDGITKVVKYSQPKNHIKCEEFYEFCGEFRTIFFK